MVTRHSVHWFSKSGQGLESAAAAAVRVDTRHAARGDRVSM
ncbi:hypothetical protein Rrhod_3663 [Rhodococcus rhodnii LMG 5362]|uniref:Uncharacterized protein n=1 Tax=Rhodococcus rhodnii LMG 5362 TaxID=1273125 RepID=R7WIL5_9NOCA|nr:hypothetical protein Rrhod_3663 [Rhodococcus rhodnii LMG 5362]